MLIRVLAAIIVAHLVHIPSSLQADEPTSSPAISVLDIALAAADSRASALINSRYAYSIRGVGRAGDETFPESKDIEVFRHPECLKVSVTWPDLGGESETAIHWIAPDRTVSVSTRGQSPARGLIQAAVPNGVRILHFENHLGLAVDGGEGALGAYLRRQIAAGAEVSAEALEMEGALPKKIRIVVAPRQSQMRREWVLDGPRGWMIQSSKSIVGLPGEERVIAELRTVAAEVVDGTWFPTEVERVVERFVDPIASASATYKVSQIKVGGVTEDDLEVVIPTQITMLDLVEKKAFRRHADGTVDPLPMQDPDTGKLIGPGTSQGGI